MRNAAPTNVRSCWRCDCTDECACAGGCSWVAPRLCSRCDITPDTPQEQRWTVRHSVHMDGPRGRFGWFGDISVCNQQPRLARVDKCFRATRTVERAWMVDGRQVEGGLYCAVMYLNAPPVLTADEFSALVRAPTTFTDMRRTPDAMTLLRLRDKGLIEFDAGKCRRTKARALTPTGELLR